MHKSVFAGSIASVVIVADQVTKWMIREAVALHESVPVVPGLFNIVHARNPGGAFSFLAHMDDAVRVPFFLVATTLAIATLIYFLHQTEKDQRFLQFALAGILGGAVGNLIDRVAFGYVTDFLDVHWRGWHWPAFNVADSFITIGVVVLLVHGLFFEKAAEKG